MATRGWPKQISKVDDWMDEARAQRGGPSGRRSRPSGRRSSAQAGRGDVGRMHAQLDSWPSLVKAMGKGPMLHLLV
jgi:hypothetical protein